jgi:hypothetical protein|tara:strand:- start:1071 stop:1292 length:222 start_codon:yes stop_codon:yes gene_type:complete
MPFSKQNIRLARTILADPGNIACIDWWHRDDIENHIDRNLTDDEWEKVSHALDGLMTPQAEDINYALEIAEVK